MDRERKTFYYKTKFMQYVFTNARLQNALEGKLEPVTTAEITQ